MVTKTPEQQASVSLSDFQAALLEYERHRYHAELLQADTLNNLLKQIEDTFEWLASFNYPPMAQAITQLEQLAWGDCHGARAKVFTNERYDQWGKEYDEVVAPKYLKEQATQ